MEGIKVEKNDETFTNCVVCHERSNETQKPDLFDLKLPFMRVTLCRKCAKEVSKRLNEI